MCINSGYRLLGMPIVPAWARHNLLILQLCWSTILPKTGSLVVVPPNSPCSLFLFVFACSRLQDSRTVCKRIHKFMTQQNDESIYDQSLERVYETKALHIFETMLKIVCLSFARTLLHFCMRLQNVSFIRIVNQLTDYSACQDFRQKFSWELFINLV